MTPRLFQLAVHGATNARIRARNDRMELAWHITILPRLKRLPTLEKLQGGRSKPRTKMSSDQMLAVAMTWHRALTAPRGSAARRSTATPQSPRKGDGHAQ